MASVPNPLTLSGPSPVPGVPSAKQAYARPREPMEVASTLATYPMELREHASRITQTYMATRNVETTGSRRRIYIAGAETVVPDSPWRYRGPGLPDIRRNVNAPMNRYPTGKSEERRHAIQAVIDNRSFETDDKDLPDQRGFRLGSRTTPELPGVNVRRVPKVSLV